MSLDMQFNLKEAMDKDLTLHRLFNDLVLEYEGLYTLEDFMKFPGYEYYRSIDIIQDNKFEPMIGVISYGSGSTFRQQFKEWLETNNISYEEF